MAMIPAGPTRKPSSTRWPEQRRGKPGQPLGAGGLGHEALDDVAHLAGMAEIFAHELLHGQQPGDRLVAQSSAIRNCSLRVEHVGGLAGVEVQLVAEPEEELARPLDRPRSRPRPARRARAARGDRRVP